MTIRFALLLGLTIWFMAPTGSTGKLVLFAYAVLFGAAMYFSCANKNEKWIVKKGC